MWARAALTDRSSEAPETATPGSENATSHNAACTSMTGSAAAAAAAAADDDDDD